MNANYNRVREILDSISFTVCNYPTQLYLGFDKKYQDYDGQRRMYIQVRYEAPCTIDHVMKKWRGRKWYLSDHMLDNEVVFTAYLAAEIAERHERMERFKIDETILVNPHVHYTKLLEISKEENEVKRESDFVTNKTI